MIDVSLEGGLHRYLAWIHKHVIKPEIEAQREAI